MADLLLVAVIAGERVAIAASDVESVVEIEAITPVPRAPVHVAGLAALRSRVLTVIDCRTSLELEAGGGASREAIVVEADGHAYALLVDAVEDVFEYAGTVEPIRTAISAGWERAARGTVDTQAGLMLLVDTQALLAGPAAAHTAAAA
jgi:purine-binding chemotaxis protein CheW